jgi:uncharacterized SAM-binding protein YcdF (DUF218 family)
MAVLWPLRLALKIVAVVVAVIVVYFGVTLVQVWLTSRQYDPRPSGAIVVMGAAQYNGLPSPVLRARLDEAIMLFHQGYAHFVVVTGSKERGDRYTEAQASARYLVFHRLPPADIAQVGGDDSWQNLSEAAPVLKSRGATTVLLVTDPFHEHRSLAIATEVGLTAYPTPTRTSPIRGAAAIPYFMKETLGVGLGRIIGYQHLHSLG